MKRYDATLPPPTRAHDRSNLKFVVTSKAEAEAEQRWDAAMVLCAEALVGRVEKALAPGKYRGGPVSVDGDDHAIMTFVALIYREAGWKVDFGHDQRDGAWFRLT